jgi:predicted amidophosphoribosyltransferase
MMRTAGEYDGALRLVIHALKYHGHRSVARRLSDAMGRTGWDVIDDADLIVPVPLHWGKRWRRGFNQAVDLARGLPRRQIVALVRRRATHPQTGLPAAERARNVRGAFTASWRVQMADVLSHPSGAGAMMPAMLRNRLAARWSVRDKIVVLVDDVRTTGATLEECARVLSAHGAREVRALTAAAAVRQ